VFFWGLSFIATKQLLNEITPEMIIVMRLLLAILLLTGVLTFSGISFSIDKNNLKKILLLSAVSVFHLWIQITGLKFTSASNTGWIIGTAPIFMAILGYFYFKEKISGKKLLGIVIAFSGLLILVGKGNPFNVDLIKNIGDWLVLLSAFTWGIYSIINKKITLSYSPVKTIFYLFLIMMIIILPFNISKQNITSVINLSAIGWFSILFLGLLCSGVSYVIWAYLLREMSSAKVGAYLYIEPFITFLGAWILLKEEITLIMLISGVIITIGVYLVNRE
jgi:drug/metabolite transporter (DMT)-like permease